jgi:hypothetical protein
MTAEQDIRRDLELLRGRASEPEEKAMQQELALAALTAEIRKKKSSC